MNLVRSLFAAILALALLGACAGPTPASYATQQPKLDMRQYFDGKLVGHGMFMDRSGEVQRRFVVSIQASWQGDTGTLDEDFVWSDGKRERRVWTLKPVAGEPGRWRGTAADVIGEAQGTISGNALHWTYRMQLPVDGKTYEVGFDDWMFLIDREVMLNRAVMSFWGMRVGEVFISFRKL